MPAAPTRTGRRGRELDAHPAASLALGVLDGGCETESGVQMARHKSGSPQDGIGGPAMAVEYPDALPHNPGGGVDFDLPRKVPDNADVMIAEDQFDAQVFREQLRKELEHYGT